MSRAIPTLGLIEESYEIEVLTKGINVAVSQQLAVVWK
jgi:hypothetical protein